MNRVDHFGQVLCVAAGPNGGPNVCRYGPPFGPPTNLVLSEIHGARLANHEIKLSWYSVCTVYAETVQLW